MGEQHLNDLKHRRYGMSSGAISAAEGSWTLTAASLGEIHKALDDAAKAMPTKKIGGEAILEKARIAFEEAAERVGKRQAQISAVAAALGGAYPAMVAIEKAADGAPTVTAPDPGPAPGKDATDQEMNDWTTAKQKYDTQTGAVDTADSQARVKVETLLKEYATTVTALQKIEGQPKVPEGNGGGDPGPGGPRYQLPPRSTPVGTWIGTDDPDDNGIHIPKDPGDPNDPHYPHYPGGHVPGQPGYTPAAPPIDTFTPTLPHAPEGGGGGGGGVGPAVLGAGAAGVFGAPGLARGLRSLVGGRGLSGSSVGAIGSSSRAGAPGSLGRAGAGTPGSPVGRGTGRGAGAGRGGGRGGAGGRGTGAAGAAGGRGRRRGDQKDGQDRDLFDDGEEWIDDEGATPGVLD